MAEDPAVRLLSRRRLYAGRVLSLDLDEVEEPGGTKAEREVVRHPGSVVILAVDAGGRILLVEQYRHPAGAHLWEIPAGRQDPGESTEEGACRELEEEAGLRARRWEHLGTLYATPGYCDEVMHVFRASELTEVPARPDEDEKIETRWITVAEAVKLWEKGDLRDAKTVLAVLLEERRHTTGG